MNEFKKYHPVVNFTYFLFAIFFSCVFMHPICLIISFLCAFIYSVMLKGKKTIKSNLLYMLPMIIIMTLVNPLFNHEGVTIIGYMKNQNPITLESIIYGFFASLMIINVICYFSCYNEVMTSDKFIYIFGKIIPSMSLIISMTLRFVPRFSKQFKIVANAQKCMGKDIAKGSIIKRLKNAISILSCMTTWALENSIETSDSMKSRGYGTQKRGSFSVFIFNKRDKKTLFIMLFFAIYTIISYILGRMYFSYFPKIKSSDFSYFEISAFVSYFMFLISPVIIEIKEAIKWNVIKSKM